MTVEEWSTLFHQAGIRVELANMAARIVVQRIARERHEAIQRARRGGLTATQIGIAFGCSKQWASKVSTLGVSELTSEGRNIGGAKTGINQTESGHEQSQGVG